MSYHAEINFQMYAEVWQLSQKSITRTNNLLLTLSTYLHLHLGTTNRGNINYP